jgi:hypothetical protein
VLLPFCAQAFIEVGSPLGIIRVSCHLNFAQISDGRSAAPKRLPKGLGLTKRSNAKKVYDEQRRKTPYPAAEQPSAKEVPDSTTYLAQNRINTRICS